MHIPLLEVAMTEAVLQEMETYVFLCQNTVSQFITIRPIMYLCLVVEKRPRPNIYTSGSRESMGWMWKVCGWRIRRINGRMGEGEGAETETG